MGTVVDGSLAAVGQPALGGALHGFAANWSHHRARIVAAADGLAAAAETAATTYEQVDAGLAAVFAGATGAPAGSARGPVARRRPTGDRL